jgi:hypothetical protein
MQVAVYRGDLYDLHSSLVAGSVRAVITLALCLESFVHRDGVGRFIIYRYKLRGRVGDKYKFVGEIHMLFISPLTQGDFDHSGESLPFVEFWGYSTTSGVMSAVSVLNNFFDWAGMSLVDDEFAGQSRSGE